MKRRGLLWGAAAFAVGAAAGAAAEELLVRRLHRKADPEATEPIGSVPGEMQWVESFDGTALHTRVYGPPDAQGSIVLAHGVTENLDLWHYQVRDLRADGRYRLVAYDHRGHGASGPARGPDGKTPFVGDTLAFDLAAVIDQTTTGPVVVVGHSLGGMASLALLVAKDYEPRARVRGAVLVNSTFTAQLSGWRGRGRPGQRAIERIGDVARLAVGGDARRIERFRPRPSDLAMIGARFWFGTDPSPRHVAYSFDMFDATPSETIAAGIDLFGFDVYRLLAAIDIPVLIVAGSRDRVTPPWLSTEMAAVIPGVELVVFEDCGHMAPFERHDDLTAQLRKFCERVLS